jgi:hypothetical protein
MANDRMQITRTTAAMSAQIFAYLLFRKSFRLFMVSPSGADSFIAFPRMVLYDRRNGFVPAACLKNDQSLFLRSLLFAR